MFRGFYRYYQYIEVELQNLFLMLLVPKVRFICGLLLILDSLFMTIFLLHALPAHFLSACLPLLTSWTLFILYWRQRRKQGARSLLTRSTSAEVLTASHASGFRGY